MKKKKSPRPNLTLTRTDLFTDAVIGRLNDEHGNLICLTLEPPYFPQKRKDGTANLTDGVFCLSYGFDEELKYGCLRVGGRVRNRNVRLCFLTKRGARPGQSRHDILLGMERKPEEGILADALTAFRRLKAYYEQKRCERHELYLAVREASDLREHQQCFGHRNEAFVPYGPEDFELQTY